MPHSGGAWGRPQPGAANDGRKINRWGAYRGVWTSIPPASRPGQVARGRVASVRATPFADPPPPIHDRRSTPAGQTRIRPTRRGTTY